MVGEEAKAEEPAAPQQETAKYKGVDGIENTRATLVGNASRDPGSLVFHRNKDQKYATIYTEMEKFFPGVCPELPRPALLDGTHPGDYGFDPAGFCTTNAELYNQMEAEVRHCRLAMLCAAGWPMAELWGQDWFDGYFLADGGRAPSILNGGLISDVQFPPLPTLAVLGFFALYGQQELKTLGTLKSQTLYGNVHKKDLEGSRRGVALGRRGRRGLRPARVVRSVGQRRRGPLHDERTRAEPRPRGHARGAVVRHARERDARADRAADAVPVRQAALERCTLVRSRPC